MPIGRQAARRGCDTTARHPRRCTGTGSHRQGRRASKNAEAARSCATIARVGATFGRGTRSISREAAFSSPAAYEYDRATDFPPQPVGSRRPCPRGLSRDPVPQRGRDDRAVRAQRARGAARERARRRGDRRRQRLRGRQRQARRAGRGDGRARARARIRKRLHGWLRGRPRPLHHDGRRRPDLRLRRDPAVRRRARQRAPTW